MSLLYVPPAPCHKTLQAKATTRVNNMDIKSAESKTHLLKAARAARAEAKQTKAPKPPKKKKLTASEKLERELAAHREKHNRVRTEKKTIARIPTRKNNKWDAESKAALLSLSEELIPCVRYRTRAELAELFGATEKAIFIELGKINRGLDKQYCTKCQVWRTGDAGKLYFSPRKKIMRWACSEHDTKEKA